MQLTPTPRARPAWLENAINSATHNDFRLFVDNQRFNDDVHGPLYLNSLERDVVDAPEFQRLFRLGQLGFVDHVYQSANHTRGAHCIAACALSKHLVDMLNANTLRTSLERASLAARERIEAAPAEDHSGREADGLEGSPLAEAARQATSGAPDASGVPQVSFASSVLISLGALLHDLPHGPFSHDIERKTHKLMPPYGTDKLQSHYGPYDKHDDFALNAALYTYLLEPSGSVLARILRAYSPLFWQLMEAEVAAPGGCRELEAFVQATRSARADGSWTDVEHSLLPSLLFHLLALESFEDARASLLTVATDFASPPMVKKWGLGDKLATQTALHRTWYRPYRHDVIGDTVSADLIDYLLRDIRRLGLRRKPDLRMLDFYVLTAFDVPSLPSDNQGQWVGWYRCAIDLNDYKRGTLRLDLVNDLLRLLDLRFEIHEKAVYHRVVQASIAMLSRAIFFLPERPSPIDAYGLGEVSPALAGDEAFLQRLVAVSRGRDAALASRLAERRVYRPLMVVPGDRLHAWLAGLATRGPDGGMEADLRLCAAMLDCKFYAPFLCYLSHGIEMLLKHAYGSVDALRADMLAIAKGPDSPVDAAMRAHSERVILWALPYKQLYKDLAVVVRAQYMEGARHQDLVTQLDELAKAWRDKGQPDDLSSLVRRVADGIVDADSKYASLWKMYVFLSDGLYSTGVLAKFAGNAGCAGSSGVGVHGACLRDAQGLVLEGLRAIWMHWHARRADGNALDLRSTCGALEFRLLLKMCGADNAELELNDHYRGDARKLSAVAVDQYLHHSGSSLYEVHEDARCRDMRFKFPRVVRGGDLAAIVSGLDLEPERKRQVKEMMELVQGAEWTEEEAAELAGHLGRQSIAYVDKMVLEAKAAQGAIDLPGLRELWRTSGDGAVARDTTGGK